VRIGLLYTDADFYAGAGYDAAWREALESLGCGVDVLPRAPAAWAIDGPPSDRWDLVVPHVLVEEVAAFAETMRAAALLEAAGVPLLNPLHAIVASSDKLTTHAVWAAAGLPQPRTWDLAALEDRWPGEPGEPLVLKPSLCDGARHIGLVRSLGEARAIVASWREDEARGGERRGAALLQEWVAEPRCVRIFATPERTSQAYEKDRAEGELVTHGTVYPHVYEPPRAMADLARRMVAALGGGLMGVDVLVDASGRHLALEANAPFGFDVTDPGQSRFVARCAVDRAHAAGRRRRTSPPVRATALTT
jgi:[lysine-biosynthesis-protein LysW]---L-2-aminoadipate ligase